MNAISEIHRILPEDVINEILDVRDRESSLAWDYGRLANKIYHYVLANGLAYTRLEVCGFVSYMVDNQKAPNTIMRYARVQEFFAGKRSAAKYSVLPFSHFELAMEFGDKWRYVLIRSLRLMTEQAGRPPSRRKLENLLRPESQRLREYETMSSPSLDYQPQDLAVRIYQDAGNDDDPSLDDLDDLQALLSKLQTRLDIMRMRYPAIAVLLAQALLIINEAIGKAHEQTKFSATNVSTLPAPRRL